MNLFFDLSDAPVAQLSAAAPHEFSTVNLEQAEALRLAVRAATAVREAAQRALKRRRNSAEQLAAHGDALAQAIVQEEREARRYAQYLSEAPESPRIP